MAFPNLSDVVATTIENRSPTIRDNVLKNNGVLSRLQAKGKVRPFSGGQKIIETLSFAENGNFGWYSGYDTLPVAAQDVITAAEFTIKQAAVPVVISGLEQLQNSGKEGLIDLLESRIGIAEATMANNVAAGIYSDGTGSGGKQLTGLAAGVPVDPTTGTYGGINRVDWSFWRSQLLSAGAQTVTTIQPKMNELYAKCVRGKDRPDLVVFDNALWALFANSLQAIQRLTDPAKASLGFSSLDYMGAEVILDGGIGGYAPTNVGYFLNTNYLHFRPHKDRNMVPLAPNKRYAVNQDAEVQILAFAGNLTCSGAQFQGYFKGS